MHRDPPLEKTPRRSLWNQRLRTAALLTGMLLAVSTVHANNYNYNCSGKVTYLGLDANGDLTLALASTPIHKICNVEQRDSVLAVASPSTCRAIYATLITAKTLDRSITLYYNPNGYSCSSFPSWARIPGVYFLQGPE